VYKIARYYAYEPNNQYTRQRLVDAIEPLLYQVKVAGGLYDYRIKGDDQINDPTTIDRNELKCAIGLKPTKTAEFIMIDFIALATGGSWSEAGF
jgi:phage tail sheath protein FI